MTASPSLRLKRLRKSSITRGLVRETSLSSAQCIAPIFVHETLNGKQEINSMPGQYQIGLKALPDFIDSLQKQKIFAVILFGIPKAKDATGSSSLNSDGVIQKAIRIIRSHAPDILIIADVCLCEYTDHGHCGALLQEQIDNDKTLDILNKQAVSFAKAGADWIAPSGMVDGMVRSIRQALDHNGFFGVAILSYAVKYASCLYGPFREAAEGAPKFGDRRSYQMDSANSNEAIREAMLDIKEGADMIMVKPAMYYLDVIYKLKQHFPEIPLCAYQVSGEYAMIKQSAKLGLLDERQAIYESLIAIKRAGADCIISYFSDKVKDIFGQ